MKKILLFFLSVIACMTVQGQTHIKFMDIPLNQSIETIHQELTNKKKFHTIVEGEWRNRYNACFFGREVEVKVSFTNIDKKVYEVEVIFPEDGEYAKKLFTTLAKAINKKYGKTESIPYVDEYSCVWFVEGTDAIHLDIKKGVVCLSYNDAEASSLYMKESTNSELIIKMSEKRKEDL